MRGYRVIVVTAALLGALFAASPEPAAAYILDARFVIDRMLDQMDLPAEFQVVQRLTFFDSRLEGGRMAVPQRISYRRPARFRSDIRTRGLQRIHVAEGSHELTIVDGKLVSRKTDVMNRYRDLFTFSDRVSLVNHLIYLGLNPAVTSYGRDGRNVVYVIGAQYPSKAPPQLWIDKERFLPVAWMIAPGERDSGLDPILFRYENWQQAAEGVYPGTITVYQGDRLVRKIEAETIETEVRLPSELFDIDYLKAAYEQPLKPPEQPETGDEIDRRIDQFRSIFESE
jgi:hypothetical protein